jgi:hypothetical protein
LEFNLRPALEIGSSKTEATIEKQDQIIGQYRKIRNFAELPQSVSQGQNNHNFRHANICSHGRFSLGLGRDRRKIKLTCYRMHGFFLAAACRAHRF